MKLKPWDYIALLAGSLAVWMVTTRVTGHVLDDRARRQAWQELDHGGAPVASALKPVAEKKRKKETTPPTVAASPSPTQADAKRDPADLAMLATETLCRGTDAEAARTCGRKFIATAKTAGFTEEEIAALVMEDLAERDPALALYLLGMIQPPDALKKSQDKILKGVVEKDPIAAMQMILEFPSGNRFYSGLETLARNLPKDASLPGRMQELMSMLPDKRENEFLARELCSSLGTPLEDGRITKDDLKTVAADPRTPTEVRYGIASLLWYHGKEPSLEKARMIMEASGGEAGSVAWAMTDELLKRDVPVKDILELSRNADQRTLERILHPLLQSKRMTFGELREAAAITGAKASDRSSNLLRDVAEEAGRLDPAMDAAMVEAIPADKRNAYRWSAIRRDIRAKDFNRAMTAAESIDDPKSRADAIEHVRNNQANAGVK